ncbi:hypothetical protein [Isoptericola hypogeus]
MSDDELVARLRGATADVPPSTLDLDAVLRSSRRKSVRHRAAVGTACLASLAVAGVGAQAAPGLWQAATDGAATPATSLPAGVCDPADVEVDWSSEQTSPVVLWVDRVQRRSGDRPDEVEVERMLGADAAEARPSVDGWGVSPPMVEGILREAGKDSKNPPTGDEQVDVATSASIGGPGEPWRMLDGFDASERGLSDGGDVHHLADPPAGTTLYFAAGTSHVASGVATCGDDEKRFMLRYWAPGDGPQETPCAVPTDDGIAINVKRAYCPDGLTEEERAVIGLDPADDASAETADRVAEGLRLAVAG